jgi:hypothetical protein
MSRWRPTLLVAALILALAPGAAAAKVPADFLGVMVDGPLFDGRPLAPELSLMRSSGVQTVRYEIQWSLAQPYATPEDVPAERRAAYTVRDGLPVDLRGADQLFLAAARARIRVMPVVQRTPDWAAKSPGREGTPPRDPADYARFMAVLVARYGRGGSLWAENPGVPPLVVRRWQVWNEPDITKYWSDRDWAPGYVRLLRAARFAIKGRDRRAEVVLAGLTNYSWRDLRKVYRAGGRTQFDVAAIHPFSRRPSGVLTIVRRARDVMRRAGDARKPLLLSEVSWSSGKGRSTFNYGWETTESGQAARVRDAIRSLTARRRTFRLAGLYWYTWLSPAPGKSESFAYSGLRRDSGRGAVDKPARRAFRDAARRVGAR